MKLVHTSDWHLGARLHEEDRSMEHAAFLDWLAALLAEEHADVLLVAGDIFDVKAPSPQAQSLYYGFLARAVKEHLCRKVVAIAGNHDSCKLLAAPSNLLGELGISVVASAAGDLSREVVVVDGHDSRPALAVAAVPFMYDAELANFGARETAADASREEKVRAGWCAHSSAAISAARSAAPGAPVVAAAHCTILDAEPSDAESERCRRVGGIEAYDPSPLAAADYVALGHLHVPQQVRGGAGRMFYSGSPLCMSFDEARFGKSVNVVTFGGPGEIPKVEKRAVPQFVPVLTLCDTPDVAKAKLAELVAADRAKRRFVRIQLKDFEGESRGHWTDLRAIAGDSGTLILEENDVRPVMRDTSGLRAFAGRGIRQLKPRDVAERKLRDSTRKFSESEIASYMAMFDEAAGGVE